MKTLVLILISIATQYAFADEVSTPEVPTYTCVDRGESGSTCLQYEPVAPKGNSKKDEIVVICKGSDCDVYRRVNSSDDDSNSSPSRPSDPHHEQGE